MAVYSFYIRNQIISTQTKQTSGMHKKIP